jgi:hypothetical protein
MRTLSIIFTLTLISSLISAPAFPSSYEFDFNSDEIWDMEWTLTPGEKVTLEVWLNDYSCPPDDKILGVSFYFQYDYTKIQVNEENSYLFDSNHVGPWSSSYSYFQKHEDGVYELGVADYGYIIVTDNKIKLAVIELECIAGDDANIKAANDLGFGGYITGYIIDCNLNSPNADDADAIVHQIAAAIPTLSEWGMIILITIILGIGVMILRRRRIA